MTFPMFPMLPLAMACSLVLAAIAVSLFATFRARTAIRAAHRLAAAAETRLQAEVQAIRQSLESLAAQVTEVEQQSRAAVIPVMPKPGMNLSKRSQALRLHRRGDRAEQIAGALEIPLQEVDLLLKVHRIVMSTVC